MTHEDLRDEFLSKAPMQQPIPVSQDVYKRQVPLYAEYHAQVDAEYPDIQERRKQKEVVRRLIGYMVDDLVSTSRANIEAAQPKSPDDVRALKTSLISFSKEAQAQMRILKSTLMDKLYRHYRVLRAVEKSANMITQLYQTFARTPADVYKRQE